jgi:DnaK suppressor protein
MSTGKDIRAGLEARRRSLVEALAGLDVTSAPVELDQARVGRLSRMDALQEQAMAKSGQQRLGLELKRIDAALRRVEDGSYGECLSCGDDIAEGRLSADPAAPLCIACAAQREGR